MALPVLLGATLPSVDDCSRSAPPAPTQGWLECFGMGGSLPSESPAGITRNARLECVGIRRTGPNRRFGRTCIGVIKRVFGFAKVRYRGLEKNAHRLFVTCALANLFIARHRLLRI